MTERLLLDTCAAIWLLQDAPLAPRAITALDRAADNDEPVFVSTVTAWEFGMLCSRGRLVAEAPPLTLFETLCGLPMIATKAMSPAILVGSCYLEGNPPRDPFDRIIIATARAYDLTIVTRDRLILDYAAAGHVQALAC